MTSLSSPFLPPIELHPSIKALHAFLFHGGKTPAVEVPAAARPIGGPAFELFEHVGADRAAVESFISQCFADNFGSRVEAFMPRLFSMRNRNGDICGAFGLRSANRNLFLEQYLDMPIEETIAARVGGKVERRAIVEVGHFSGTFPGAVRAMIRLLTERLHREGFEWVVFTGTTGLRNAFCRLVLCPLDIQAATADRLPADARAVWGSYYDYAPRVLVGNIQEGYRAMHLSPVPKQFRAGDSV
jgi:hypothetical protein